MQDAKRFAGRGQAGSFHLALDQPLGSFNALRLPESDHWRLVIGLFPAGEVAEWSNVPDSKSGVPQGTGGSNPSLSASLQASVLPA